MHGAVVSDSDYFGELRLFEGSRIPSESDDASFVEGLLVGFCPIGLNYWNVES